MFWDGCLRAPPFLPAGQLSHYRVHVVPERLVLDRVPLGKVQTEPGQKQGRALASSAWLNLFHGPLWFRVSLSTMGHGGKSTSTSSLGPETPTASFSPAVLRQHVTGSD